MPITHKKQQQIWEKEHKNPYVLQQMDSKEASSGVLQFIDWLQQRKSLKGLRGVELGCGKGRNVIKLAELGIEMVGIDFSPSAIKEAQKRAKESNVETTAKFIDHDATIPWPFDSDSFDFAIDCFATTDIEDPEGRKFAAEEIKRVLKPSGYLLTYLLSPEDEFHKEMLQQSPADEKNAFLHPTTGKFEKTFDRDEILNLYTGLTLVIEKRIEKVATFFGKQYNCYHHWIIFEKE
jgi:ubiquinone/menaquinone biosynthesis C-methylase UbiE